MPANRAGRRVAIVTGGRRGERNTPNDHGLDLSQAQEIADRRPDHAAELLRRHGATE